MAMYLLKWSQITRMWVLPAVVLGSGPVMSVVRSCSGNVDLMGTRGARFDASVGFAR